MEELIAIFKNFLQENHCLESYIQNMKNYKTSSVSIPVPGGLIIRAFVWDGTKEGYSYWRNRDSRWIDLYGSNDTCINREDLISQLENADNLWEN